MKIKNTFLIAFLVAFNFALSAQNLLLNGSFTDSTTVQVSCNAGLVKLVYPTGWAFGGQYKGVTMWGNNIYKRMTSFSPSNHPVYQISGYATAYTDTMYQYVTLPAGKYSFSGSFKGGSIGTATVNLIVNKLGQSTNLLSTSIPNISGFNGSSFTTYTADVIIPSNGVYRIALSATNPTGGWIWLGFADFSLIRVKPTVHTIGDSTVATWMAAQSPWTGWGQVFNFFMNNDSVSIDNKAISGATSLSFYNNYWQGVKANVRAGDFVFIQFGINDYYQRDSIFKTNSFKSYLTKFITETQSLGAFPVLITPMSSSATTNAYNGSYGTFPDSVRQLSSALSIPLIDLDALSKALFSSVGNAYVTNYIFLNLAAGDYINYPNGKIDYTHFQKMGAIEMAKLVVQGIRNLSSDNNVKKLIPFLNPTYQVTFNSNNSLLGTTTRTEYYPAGIKVIAKALSAPGSTFLGWSGDLSSSAPIDSFTMGTTPKMINAEFSIATSIASGATLNSFNVFPNPLSDGRLHVKASLLNSSNLQLTITNLVGGLLLTRSLESLKSGCLDEIVDLSFLPKGTYMLTLRSNEGKKTLKLFCK